MDTRVPVQYYGKYLWGPGFPPPQKKMRVCTRWPRLVRIESAERYPFAQASRRDELFTVRLYHMNMYSVSQNNASSVCISYIITQPIKYTTLFLKKGPFCLNVSAQTVIIFRDNSSTWYQDRLDRFRARRTYSCVACCVLCVYYCLDLSWTPR